MWLMDETDVRLLIYLFIYLFFVEAMNTKGHWVKGKFDHVYKFTFAVWRQRDFKSLYCWL